MSDQITWQKLEPISAEFADARLQLHWAAQTIAAVGGAHVEARPDDSHRNLEWFADSNVLGGNLSNTTPPFRLALHPSGLELRLLDPGFSVVASMGLVGLTLNETFKWAEEAIAGLTGADPVALTRPEYELPQHPVASGARFSIRDAELEALEKWYANSDAVLRKLQADTEGASDVRCWPHHFDIALLISLPTDGENESKSVGVGMTPGDGTFADPYWYVTPWPYPTDRPLPQLSGGHWHTEGWTGAVLQAGELVSADDQPQFLKAYLSTSISGSRSLLT